MVRIFALVAIQFRAFEYDTGSCTIVLHVDFCFPPGVEGLILQACPSTVDIIAMQLLWCVVFEKKSEHIQSSKINMRQFYVLPRTWRNILSNLRGFVYLSHFFNDLEPSMVSSSLLWPPKCGIYTKPSDGLHFYQSGPIATSRSDQVHLLPDD